MVEEKATDSPQWGNTTKLVISLSFVAIAAILLIRFRGFIGPLLLAFVIAYLFQPVCVWLNKKLKIPWRLSVGILYLLIVFLLIGMLTWGGIALVDQFESMANFLQRTISNLPGAIDNLLESGIHIGAFEYQFDNIDIDSLTSELFGSIQPIMSQVGSFAGSFASGAATILGWIAFILIISFFILAETEGIPDRLINLNIPGYQDDIKRMGLELNRIWNAFLRGQIILMAITIVVYTLVLAILGVKFFYGLALVAGLARFVPYIGPTIAWIVYALVTLFQGETIFGLTPFAYTLMVVGISLLMDGIIDSLVTPRIMGGALRVHPAAVMLAAFVGVSILGVVGVVLAAPTLATLMLFGRYSIRKLLDLDPWTGMKLASSDTKIPAVRFNFREYFKKFTKNKKPNKRQNKSE